VQVVPGKATAGLVELDQNAQAVNGDLDGILVVMAGRITILEGCVSLPRQNESMESS